MTRWYKNGVIQMVHPDFPEEYISAASAMEWRKVQTQSIPPMDLDIEALANKLWEKIYNKPAIIPCSYCKSHNAVTNPTCVQCGGPLGG